MADRTIAIWHQDVPPFDNRAPQADARAHMDAFAALAPCRRRTRTCPSRQAFDWSRVGRQLGAGEWYLVAFRSIRRLDADEARLTEFDDRAHHEAQRRPGFVHYFKGPAEADRSCLSFCLWTSRAEARAASGRPAHIEAVSVINEMYERYTLEFLRVTGREGSPLLFEPYDAAPLADPAAMPFLLRAAATRRPFRFLRPSRPRSALAWTRDLVPPPGRSSPQRPPRSPRRRRCRGRRRAVSPRSRRRPTSRSGSSRDQQRHGERRIGDPCRRSTRSTPRSARTCRRSPAPTARSSPAPRRSTGAPPGNRQVDTDRLCGRPRTWRSRRSRRPR